MQILDNYQKEEFSEVEITIESAILEELAEHRANILLAKQEEYAIDADRYRNFVEGSEVFRSLTGRFLKSSDYLVALMCKHLVCIEDMMFGRAKNVTKSVLLEKFGDTLNYLDILKEMVIDKRLTADCTVELFALDAKLKRDFLQLSERLATETADCKRKMITV